MTMKYSKKLKSHYLLLKNLKLQPTVKHKKEPSEKKIQTLLFFEHESNCLLNISLNLNNLSNNFHTKSL
jgi:hypothetical protein